MRIELLEALVIIKECCGVRVGDKPRCHKWRSMMFEYCGRRCYSCVRIVAQF